MLRAPTSKEALAMSTTRISLERAFQLQPQIPRALRGLTAAATQGGIDHVLAGLIEVRVSQINGCSYCLDLHCRQARERGVDQQKLDVLPGWRETTFFTDRERAALAWSEVLTTPQDKEAIARCYPALQAQFSEEEIVNLTAVIVVTNGWNRVVAGLGPMPDRIVPNAA
jgi:AhpD family alkylhydroperoxidase